MKTRCLWILLSALVLTGAGCLNRNKPSPYIATDVEESFKQRWIAKRMTELQQSGVADPRAARVQATDEFRKKYEYIRPAPNGDPMAVRP